jgi:adenosylcobinamide-phosphate synthase
VPQSIYLVGETFILNRAKVVLLAVGLDLLLGEPEERWHPVVWMGRLVGRLERAAPQEGAVRQLSYGAAVEAVCLAVVMLPAWLAERLLPKGASGLLAAALLLKPVFAVRALFRFVLQVEQELRRRDLVAARGAVGRIVSRDVKKLDEVGVAAAAVESLSENSSDSVVAPLLYYVAFGLPGAYLYRMANTLDARVGYRGKYEYIGKTAARVDDLLNFVPARLTALATVAVSWMAGGSPGESWRVAVRDSSCTASPNSGWPMAAAAGALNLRLEKAGHYVLGAEGKPPEASDVGRARRLVAGSLGTAVLCILLFSWRKNRVD